MPKSVGKCTKKMLWKQPKAADKKQQKLNLEIAQNYKDKNTSYYGKLYNSYCVIC